MEKKGGFRKTWHRRWFTMDDPNHDDPCLNYFEDESMNKLLGSIAFSRTDAVRVSTFSGGTDDTIQAGGARISDDGFQGGGLGVISSSLHNNF